MGQIPNKTYTAPDGFIYRVEADGSVTKIKNELIQSNEPQSKYKTTPDGKIYRIETDGSFTAIDNASRFNHKISQENNTLINKTSSAPKGWLMSSYNWLFLISLMMILVSGMSCIYLDCYGDSAFLGMLSTCVAIATIVLIWSFKSISKVWVFLLALLLTASLTTIIVFSPEWAYIIQIAFAFISLLAFGIAYVKNINR